MHRKVKSLSRATSVPSLNTLELDQKLSLSSSQLTTRNTTATNTATTRTSTNTDAKSEETEEDDIRYGQKNGRKVIVSGTLDRLIESLADETYIQDQDYVKNFIITHQYFTTSEIFLKKLFDRFNMQIPEGVTGEQLENFERTRSFIRIRVINVVKKWVETCFSDFQTNPALLPSLHHHLDLIKDEHPNIVQFVRRTVDDMMNGDGAIHNRQANGEVPRPRVSIEIDKKNEEDLRFFDFSSCEVARQLTLVESSLFRLIPKDEFLNKGFNDPKVAPNLHTMINRFNLATAWIGSEILSVQDLRRRTAVLAKFLKIGKRYKDMNNFNGVMEIYSSLSLTPVSRLRQTWAGLSEKHRKIFAELEDLVNPSNNYSKYRQIIKTVQPPVLPFQGVYLTDLTFIEENTNRLTNGLVNFDKMQMLGRLIDEVLYFQSVRYKFEEVPKLRDWLTNRQSSSYTNEELYSRSKLLEPSTSSPTSYSPASSSPTSPPASKKSWFKSVRFPSVKELLNTEDYNFMRKSDKKVGRKRNSFSPRSTTISVVNTNQSLFTNTNANQSPIGVVEEQKETNN
eukprot:TRINITY_DN878_c0_g1_i1.p1 TRINITY_DN878_c0_g1~~TRINITY_DN878_c0_g1_i1.p1  ORF type:complete len:566 (-),score=122.75 TRINITY_DN878_c0_g1_i1:70-1767(-)